MKLLYSTLIAGSTLLSAASAAAADVNVGIDETRSLVLDRPVATLSVGNPAIAGVSVQDGKTLFLLGRSFGRTNILALDDKGQTIADMTVYVTSASSGSVTVYRGAEQITYNCAPNCERAIMPGDAKDAFDTLSGQVSTKTAMSESAAKQ